MEEDYGMPSGALEAQESSASAHMETCEGATAIAENATEEIPQWLQDILCKAAVLSMCTRFPEAVATIDDGLKLDPTNKMLQKLKATALYECGNSVFERRDFKKAIEYYSGAIALDQNNHDVFHNRSAANAKLGNYEDALADIEKAVLLKADWWKYYLMKGAVLTRLKRYSEAAQAYDEGLHLDPSNRSLRKAKIATLLEHGQAAREQGNLEEALRSYTEGIQIAPNDSMFYSNRAIVYNDLERHEDALEDAEKAIHLQPDGSKGYLMKGVSLTSLRRFPEAILTFNKGLLMDPTNQDLLKRKGFTLYYQGKAAVGAGELQEAVNFYTDAIALDSDNCALYSNRSAAFAKMGKYQEALADAERATKSGTGFSKVTTLIDRGNAFFMCGNFKDTVVCYTEAITFDPNNYNLYCKRAIANSQLGNELDALKDGEKVIQLKPDLWKGYYIKGKALLFLRLYTKARKAYLMGLRLNPNQEILVKALADCEAKISERRGTLMYQFHEDLASSELVQHPDTADYMKDLGNLELAHEMFSKMKAIFDARISTEAESAGASQRHGKVGISFSEMEKELGFTETPEQVSISELGDGDECDPGSTLVLKWDEEKISDMRPEKLKAMKEREAGDEAWRKKDLASAIKHYDSAIDLDPTDITFNINKADVYFEMRDYEQCIRTGEIAIDIGRSNNAHSKHIAVAFTTIGNAYRALHLFSRAKICYENSLEEYETRQAKQLLNKVKASLSNEHGIAYFSEGNLKEAIDRYTEAIQLDPHNHLLYSNRSEAFSRTGKYEDALSDAEEAIHLKPDWGKGYLRKGIALIHLERIPEAVFAYDKAKQVDPTTEQLLHDLWRQDSQTVCEHDMEKCKSSSGPSDSVSSQRTSHAQEDLKDLENIKSVRNRKLFPSGALVNEETYENPDLLLSTSKRLTLLRSEEVEKPEVNKTPQQLQALKEKEAGNEAYKMKDFKSAIKHYEEAIALDPSDMTFLSNKAAAFYEMKNYEKCISSCRKAVDIGRENKADLKLISKVLCRAGKAYGALKDYGKSADFLKQSFESHPTTDVCKLLCKAVIFAVQLKGNRLSKESVDNYLNVALSAAVHTGCLQLVTNLVRTGANVNHTTSNGQSLLTSSCLSGNLDLVMTLINAGADLNMQDGDGRTALHYAVLEGKADLFKPLLKAGAKFDLYDKLGESALTYALDNNWRIHPAVFAKTFIADIIDRKSDTISYINCELIVAVRQSDTKRVVKLLQRGANPNYVLLEEYLADNPSELVKNKSVSILNAAVSVGNSDVVKLLLDAGADVNFQNENGSVLMHAIISGKENIVLQVLSKNPDVNIKDSRGYTALVLAIRQSSNKVISEIMAMVSDVNTESDIGVTPLRAAIEYKRSLWVKRLLEAGAKIDHEDTLGTPLHLAACIGHLPSIQILVSMGSNPSSRDRKGFTAEDLCHTLGHYQAAWWLNKATLSMYRQHNFRPELGLSKELCDNQYNRYTEAWKSLRNQKDDEESVSPNAPLKEFIQQQHAETVNAQDRRGRTQLHDAAANGRVHMIKALLEAGAVPNSLTHDFITPLDLAYQNKHHEAVQILKNHFDDTEKSTLEKCQLYWKLLKEISKFKAESELSAGRSQEVIKEVSSLLASGAPMIPPGTLDPHVLHLAISSNNTLLLSTIITAGAPLVSSVCGLGIVQLAWRTPDITTYVGVIVTRAVACRLVAEIGFEAVDEVDRELKNGVKNIIEQLEGDHPWKAKYPVNQLTAGKLTSLLVRACSHGATTAAWWLRQAGGSTILCDSETGHTALHAALLSHHYRTAADLIHHMGANPFLPNKGGLIPIDLFQEKQKKEIIQDCLARESTKLDRMLVRTLTGHKNQQEEVKFLIILLSVLSVLDSKNEGIQRAYLEEFFYYSLLSEEDLFCHLLDSKLSDIGDDFWKLLDHLKVIHKNFEAGKYITDTNIEKKQTVLDSVLTDALKLCSERRFPLFLHLLVSVARVEVNDILNCICHTTALHYAAANGNMSSGSYLLSKGAKLNIKDKYGCTPTHYAYMYGHKLTGDFLVSQLPSSPEIHEKCSIGRTAIEYWDAFKDYAKASGVDEDPAALEYSDPTLLIKHHLNSLEKEWRTNGIRNSVRNDTVNFESGEAADIQKAVFESLQALISKVADINPVFTGELKQLGSSADGVRFFCPDEFDFNLILEKKVSGLIGGGLKVELKRFDKNTAAWKGYDRYFSVKAQQSELSSWDKGSILLPEFLRLLKLCLADFCFADDRLSLVPPGVKYKMVGAGLTLRWSGTLYPLLLIDIDLVPVVQAPWPEDLCRPSLLTLDVDRLYVSTSLTDEWRLSSGILENHIMQNLTEGQKDVFLACKMLVSVLKVEGWVPTQIKQQYKYFDNQLFKIPVLNGFILKNCFFKEMEERQEEQYWREDLLLDRVISIFQRMCHPLKEEGGIRYIPSQVYAYFGGAIITTKDSGERVVSDATDKSYLGYGAPEILQTLESLKNRRNFSF